MRYGLILNSGSARENVEIALRAEGAGFDGVFSVEFHNRHGFATLGAIAQATEQIQIGTGIANAFTRSPLLHASAALDLDELSGGRMVLGLGSATRRMNEDWFGVPFGPPAPRMRELVRLLRAVFEAREGPGFRWAGSHWNLNIPNYSRPGAPRDDIPIWVAAVNRGMIAAAGATADGLVGHPVASRRWHREVTLPGLRAAENTAEREEGACALVPYVMTSIHEDRETAIADAKSQIGFYFTTGVYHTILDLHGLREVGDACRAALRQMDTKAMAAAVPDALVDEIAIACTPDEARDRLEAWRELTDWPLLYGPTAGVPAGRARDNLDAILDLFGTERGAES